MFTTRVNLGSRAARRQRTEAALNRIGQAAARATDQVTRNAHRGIRDAMSATKLGKLGRAVKYSTDVKKGRVPKVQFGRPWRAGGIIFIASKSERTLGAFEAYTEGATIVPRKGRWLWIATDEIPNKVGRYRMTPARYIAGGFENRIGELEFIEGSNNGEAFLIVRDVTVRAATGFGRARRLPRNGNVRPGRKAVDFVVAFIGIRITRRNRRLNPEAIAKAKFRELDKVLRDRVQTRRSEGRVIAASGGSGSARFTGTLSA